MTEDLILDVDCPSCGLIELEQDQAWLVIASEPSLSHYAFECPRCGTVARYHAEEVIVDALAPLLAVEMLDVPAEALETHTGPALTVDDLLDLCLALDTLDYAIAG